MTESLDTPVRAAEGKPPPVPREPRSRKLTGLMLLMTILGAALLVLVIVLTRTHGDTIELELGTGTVRLAEAKILDPFELPVGHPAPMPGEDLLAVVFQPVAADVGALEDDFMQAASDAYVTSLHTQRVDIAHVFATGVGPDRLVIYFTPPAGASGFRLHWPGAEPGAHWTDIDLGL